MIHQHRSTSWYSKKKKTRVNYQDLTPFALSPFTFWRVNESSVLRFFKLIGYDNGKVGNYAALVKERNDTAHANGNIFFSTQAASPRL